MDSGCSCGGICKLCELIAEHPAELAYDFRTKFGLSLFDIERGVSLLEATMLVAMLLRDTNSWLHAASADWQYPVSREWIVAAHSYELLAAVNSKKKPKPYPAPWPEDGKKRIGRTKKSTADVLAQLRRMNPSKE